jgi:hypothetical protein
VLNLVFCVRELKAFLKIVLKRILEPKRDETIGDWRKLNSEELHNLFSLDIIGIISQGM